MAQKIQTLPGFRDFFPEGCAQRNYLFDKWRSVATRYGFVEYEGPVLESTDLYRRKSGDEIVHQLFHFVDKGDRDVAMRPELTPTLARMAAAKQRDYKKPMKWFSIGQFFRYEKQQKGRTREFYQFNCDILGEPSPAADAELVALAIDMMRDLGFTAEHFKIRLSDRNAWTDFAGSNGVAEENLTTFLQIIDKLEREKPEVTETKLGELGLSLDKVRAFIDSKGEGHSAGALDEITADLDARGLGEFVDIDLNIVRGLAYYTGPVFEIFDIGKGMRAVAGGGRYDSLVELIGGVPMAAAGFAMGDVVIGDLISETPAAAELREKSASAGNIDVFVVVADEARRPEALGCLQTLRSQGYRTICPLTAAKVNKQFQAAEQQGATISVLFGSEYPTVTIKNLVLRLETTCDIADFDAEMTRLLMPS